MARFDEVNRAAHGRWPGILRSLAGLDEQQMRDVHQPCPACGGTDRYRYDDKEGDGRWYCNQCGGLDHSGGAGDGWDLLRRVTGWDASTALHEVAGYLGMADADRMEPPATPVRAAPDKLGRPRPTVPAPDDAPTFPGAAVYNPKRDKTHTPKPSAVYPYHNADGGLVGYVLRLEIKGEKWTPQVTWVDGRWSLTAFPRPKPLYGLLDLGDARQVIVVEGEKCRDALAPHVPMPVVSWPGGGKGVKHADWSPLAGRKVVLWPDADDEGYLAMVHAAQLLRDTAAGVRMVDVSDHADGWDAADAIEAMPGEDIMGWIKARLIEPPRPPEPEPEPARPEPPAPTETPPDPAPSSPGYPFRALGYDNGHYYALPQNTLQITAIPQASVTSKGQMISLAPKEWWDAMFSGSQGVDWTAAANAVARWCEQKGVFDPSIIRGRGAWYDKGRAVLHLGDRLVIDGEPKPVSGADTDYVYELRPRLDTASNVEPLPASEGRALRRLLGMIHWHRPVSPILVAGWVFLAPVCGALQWRPHLYITGQRGSGKSYVINEILRPCLGPGSVIVQSSSTEAGIRQMMQLDARPVLFDEAEAESQRDRQRIQGVFELARQASSESSAEIAKGTAGGRAQLFRTRSMFLMGSINVTLTQAADVSRFTVCSLDQPPKGDAGVRDFDSIKAVVAETITPEFTERMRARAYRSIPAIRENATIFGRAVARHLGDQRIGDQIGTLLAGAYALENDGVISEDAAVRQVEALDWSEAQESQQAASDQRRLVDELLSARVRTEGHEHVHERTIAELVAATQGASVPGVDYRIADDTLQRHGLRPRGTELLVSNSHSWIRQRLADTPWGGGWSQILSYVDGARSVGPTRFAGQSTRATGLPVGWVLGD